MSHFLFSFILDHSSVRHSNNWKTVYLTNTILYIVMAFYLTVITVCCVRCSILCAPLLCSFNVAIFIVTGLFRFGTLGKLCALSTAETSDGWTFEDDGELIARIWIC